MLTFITSIFAASAIIQTMDQSSREEAADREAEDSLLVTLTLEGEEAVTVICVKVELLLLNKLVVPVLQ